MITRDMIGKVRRMHFRDPLSFSDIEGARACRATPRRSGSRRPLRLPPRYRREAMANKQRAFHEAVIEALRVDLRRLKNEWQTSQAL